MIAGLVEVDVGVVWKTGDQGNVWVGWRLVLVKADFVEKRFNSILNIIERPELGLTLFLHAKT